MPCQLTHMYLACRIAQEYSGAHKDNDVIQTIHKGFIAWLQANEDFKKGRKLLSVRIPEAICRKQWIFIEIPLKAQTILLLRRILHWWIRA